MTSFHIIIIIIIITITIIISQFIPIID